MKGVGKHDDKPEKDKKDEATTHKADNDQEANEGEEDHPRQVGHQHGDDDDDAFIRVLPLLGTLKPIDTTKSK